MSEYTGRKISFGIAREAVRGTAETAADYWLNHMSLGFYPRADKVVNESALGVLHKDNDSALMSTWAEGDFEMKAGDQSVGMLLLGGFGSVSTGDNPDANAAVKDHTFTFDQSNQPQSFTFFRKDPNVNEAFALGMFDTLEFNAELGGWVMVTGSLMAKAAEASSATVARISENEFKPKHIGLRLAANVAGLAGATDMATLQSVRLTINRNIDRDYALGSQDPYDISVREIEISGEFVVRHTDAALLDNFLADDHQAMRLSIVNSDVTIGDAANPGLVFTLPKVSFDNWEIGQDLGDKVNQTVGFRGLYDTTAASAMSAVLTNTVASY